MYNWLVPVDGSENCEWALQATLENMDLKNDKLHLLNVVQTGLPLNDVKELLGMKRDEKNLPNVEQRRILQKYEKLARDGGATNIFGDIMSGSNVGEVICEFAKQKKINNVVLGYKGVGGMVSGIASRIFGTTSRYVFENCLCDVSLIKTQHGPEIHSDRKIIVEAEEKERKRRIDNPQETADKRKLANTVFSNLTENLQTATGDRK